MKKQTTAVIACVALCAAVWPQNTEVGDLPTEPVKTAVTASVATAHEEPLHIIFFADTKPPEPAGTEESTAEKGQAPSPPDEARTTGIPEPTSTPSLAPKSATSSASPSSDPKPGTIAVIDGNRCMWVPGFGWVKDEGGGSQGTMVGSPGDELTGNKVGQMGGGTIVDGKGDINKQVGIMGADNPPRASQILL